MNSLSDSDPAFQKLLTSYGYRSSLTELFERFTIYHEARGFAHCLLHKPTFEVEVIVVGELFRNGKLFYGQKDEWRFCLGLLAKSHYDLSSVFRSGYAGLLIAFVAETGVRVTHLSKCGIDLGACEVQGFSVVRAALPFWLHWFQSSYGNYTLPVPFPDEEFLGYSDITSEDELKEYCRDLVINCNLNLDIHVEELPQPFNIPSGTVLSQLEALANSPYFQEQNIFKDIVEELRLKRPFC